MFLKKMSQLRSSFPNDVGVLQAVMLCKDHCFIRCILPTYYFVAVKDDLKYCVTRNPHLEQRVYARMSANSLGLGLYINMYVLQRSFKCFCNHKSQLDYTLVSANIYNGPQITLVEVVSMETKRHSRPFPTGGMSTNCNKVAYCNHSTFYQPTYHKTCKLRPISPYRTYFENLTARKSLHNLYLRFTLGNRFFYPNCLCSQTRRNIIET